MAAILDFTHNAMTNIRSGHPYVRHAWKIKYTPKLLLCFYSVNSVYSVNLLFHLALMAAILDFIHNAMSKVLSDYNTMSGITEARTLDTKIKNLRLFRRK